MVPKELEHIVRIAVQRLEAELNAAFNKGVAVGSRTYSATLIEMAKAQKPCGTRWADPSLVNKPCDSPGCVLAKYILEHEEVQ
jgi:hypothetical protein